MTSLSILPPAEEDALHAYRLLNIEDRVFKRLSKKLLTASTLLDTVPGAPPTPPPDGEAAEEAELGRDTATEDQTVKFDKWREETLLEFAAFESNVVRVQLLLDSNERERQRYVEEKANIEKTEQEVREGNSRLAERLAEAEATRDLRKTYDALADEITSKKMLRPRDEQKANIQKHSTEIAELEREKEDYRKTWAERRDQFDRIVEEGRNMLRLIRDEKEEAERMDDMAGSDSEATPRASTPKPSGAATPMGAAAGESSHSANAQPNTSEHALNDVDMTDSKPGEIASSGHEGPKSSDQEMSESMDTS